MYNAGVIMRVYLDNCCYNRPFDEQAQAAVRLESEAKLLIQALMRMGTVEYAWSFILQLETSRNPDPQRKNAIQAWRAGATIDIAPSDEIRQRAREFEGLGIRPADAIHLACAEAAQCDWFFTVDRGILKKMRSIGEMRVSNPAQFVLEGFV